MSISESAVIRTVAFSRIKRMTILGETMTCKMALEVDVLADYPWRDAKLDLVDNGQGLTLELDPKPKFFLVKRPPVCDQVDLMTQEHETLAMDLTEMVESEIVGRTPDQRIVDALAPDVHQSSGKSDLMSGAAAAPMPKA